MTAAAAEAPSDESKRVVLLIDLSALFWGAWHSSGADEISAARRRTLEMIQRCIGDSGQDKLIAICCDKGRSFRKDINEQYKANRPEKDLQVLSELDRIQAELRSQGYPVWEAAGFEADDVIATATKIATERGHAVIVASGDKDLLQLLALPGVNALRTHNFTECDRQGVKDKFGVWPEQLGDWLALVGDASDNVRGVPSVGPKTAATLLEVHGSIAGITERLHRDPNSVATPSVVRALQQNLEALAESRALVDLRYDVPIEFDTIYAPRVKARKESKERKTAMDNPDSRFAAPTANGTHKPDEQAATTAQQVAMTVLPPRQIQQVNFETALEPVDLEQAFRLANALWESRLYSRYPSEEAIAAVIIRGRELGIGALTALDLFHVIEGKPAPIAHFLISLAERDPNCEYFGYVGGDMTYAEYETKHRKRDKPTTFRYTVEEAILAGYCRMEIPERDWNAKDGKDHRGQWDKNRRQMLRKTAGVQLARLVYPTSILGLYAAEELGGGDV